MAARQAKMSRWLIRCGILASEWRSHGFNRLRSHDVMISTEIPPANFHANMVLQLLLCFFSGFVVNLSGKQIYVARMCQLNFVKIIPYEI